MSTTTLVLGYDGSESANAALAAKIRVAPVIGTVGENPITGALLGSVVLRVVQRSTLPVHVFPTSEG